MFHKLQKTPWVVPIAGMAILALIISSKLFIEDFWTSFRGYQALDTRKVTDVFGYVSLLPQVMPTLVSFYLIQNWNAIKTAWNQNPLPTFFRVALYGVIVVLFLGVDVYSDVYYKSYEFARSVPLAIAESIIVYTLGSEILFSISAPLALSLFAPAIAQIFILMAQGYWSLNGALDQISVTWEKLSQQRTYQKPNSNQNRSTQFQSPKPYQPIQSQPSRGYRPAPPTHNPNYPPTNPHQPTFINPPQRKP